VKTKTIGEILQDERLRHHLSIKEMAQRTRIRPEYLEALERNEFSELPASTFVKGFIKTYAGLFNLDPLPLLGILRRDYKESASGTLVPREFIKPVLKRRLVWTPITVTVLALGAIFFTLMSYLVLQWYNLQKPPILIVESPLENAFVSPQIKVAGQTVSDGKVMVNSQPVSILPNGTFETDVYLPREGIHVITVEVADRRGKKNQTQRSVHVRF